MYVVIKDMQPVGDYCKVFDKYRIMKGFMEVPNLVAIRENDLDKIKDNDLFVELKVYVDRVVDHLKNDVKSRIKYRHSLMASHITRSFPQFVMMDSTLTAIRANASGSPVGRALNIAKYSVCGERCCRSTASCYTQCACPS